MAKLVLRILQIHGITVNPTRTRRIRRIGQLDIHGQTVASEVSS